MPSYDALLAERDEMRRLGREAEMERDTLAHANARLREHLAEARALFEELSRTDKGQLHSKLHGTESLVARTREELQRAHSASGRYLHERDQARDERDEARHALRRHLAGQLLPADAYPWLDEELP